MLLRDNGLVGKKTMELKQPICFKDILNLEWKSENVMYWRKGYTFVSIENKKYGFLHN